MDAEINKVYKSNIYAIRADQTGSPNASLTDRICKYVRMVYAALNVGRIDFSVEVLRSVEQV